LFDGFTWQLVALRVELGHVLELLGVGARPIVEEFELLVVQASRIEAPEDVLEVKGAVAVVDQHHSRQVFVRVEVLKWVLRTKKS